MGKVQREFVVDVVEPRAVIPGCTVRGRIGMCRLPGYEPRELATDVAALAEFGAAVVVSLIQTEELYLLLGLMEPDIGFFPQMARAPFHHRHFAIRNGGAPTDIRAFAALIDALVGELTGGRAVVLHCVAGHGRTGLAAACCLVRLGLDATSAIDVVRRHRPGAIESSGQEQFIHDYARTLGEGPATRGPAPGARGEPG